MKKKQVYTLLSVLTIIIFYFLNDYIDQKKANKSYKEKSVAKINTNTFYLPSSTTNYVVHHNYYSLSYNEAHEQAEWVAYELKKEHIIYNKFKRPYFISDASIITKSADWRNYKNSGYDKGHLCPAGDRRFNKKAHDETFLTSNISPQKHDFNSGIWNKLEQKTRYWAKKYNGVFVITGGVLNNTTKKIGNENVTVPNYFYKILLDNNNGTTKVIAFLLPHEDSQKPLQHFVVSVDEIETLTGIDFFENLNDTLERKLEANTNYKAWSFR